MVAALTQRLIQIQAVQRIASSRHVARVTGIRGDLEDSELDFHKHGSMAHLMLNASGDRL